MPGTPGPESADPSAQVTPPDWPAPDAPLPWDEPTQELPVVTRSSASGTWNGPTLARAALSLALSERKAEQRTDAPAPPATVASTGVNRETAPEPAASPTASPAASPTASPAASSAVAEALSPVGEPSRRWLVAAGVAAVALVLTGGTVVALSRGEPEARRWAPPAAAAAHTVTASLDGRTAAAFDVVDGAGTVTVRTADLGDGLYRVSTPEGSAVAPRTDERDGRIRLLLDGGADTVDIALSTRVRWDLRMAGGADRSTIDLSRGRVAGIDLSGGARRITLTLPEPDGTLTVRMSGGANSFDVRTAGQAPVRVQVGRGAGQVVLDGRTHRGVAAGRTFTPRSWRATADRVDLSVAGLAALTVAPTGG